jgi:hypothetical protein
MSPHKAERPKTSSGAAPRARVIETLTTARSAEIQAASMATCSPVARPPPSRRASPSPGAHNTAGSTKTQTSQPGAPFVRAAQAKSARPRALMAAPGRRWRREGSSLRVGKPI